MRKEELKHLMIDTDNGICRINGQDLGDCISELHIEFKDGKWTLQVTQDKVFETCNAKKIKE